MRNPWDKGNLCVTCAQLNNAKTFFILDYDAPLSEAGDMTPKYRSIKDAIKQHAPEHSR